MNYQGGYSVPIIAVLCDGRYFYFFEFLDRRHTHRRTPQFSLGTFPDGHWRQVIVDMDPSEDPAAFMYQIRHVSESFYYIFLRGFQTGLQAYWNRSMERSKSEGTERQSTPGWYNATVSAGKALAEAKLAWDQRQENKLEESEMSAMRAVEFLTER